MTRKTPDTAARRLRELHRRSSRRNSTAVDVTLAEVVLDAQRRLNLQAARDETDTEPIISAAPVLADQLYADQLVELVYAEPGREGDVPAASWVLPAELGSVHRLRARIVAFASEHDVPAVLVGDLRLAASEAITNAVLHAFRERATPGSVTASIKIDRPAGRVTVLVTDDGTGMVPRVDSPGLGLGLPLIARVADLTTIRPGVNGVGTQVCITFALDERR